MAFSRTTHILLAAFIVLLLFSGAAAATVTTNHVTNPTFANNGDGWSVDKSAQSDVYFSGAEARLYPSVTGSTYTTHSAGVSQVVDLTGVTQITLQMKGESTNYGTTHVAIGSTELGSVSSNNIPTYYYTYTYSVPANLRTSGQTLKIYADVYSASSTGTRAANVQVTNVQANTISYVPPTINSLSLDHTMIDVADSIGASVSYTLGDTPTAAGQAKIVIDWDDGNTDNIDLYGVTSPQTRGHTYSSPGTYTIKAKSYWGATLGTTKTQTAYVYEVSIDASPAVGSMTNGRLQVLFTPEISGSYNSVSWDFGDGQTSTLLQPVHDYTSNGAKTVTLTVYTNYGTLTKTKENAVIIGDNGVSGPAQVTAGDTATITWSLLEPNFNAHTYQLSILSGTSYTDVVTRQTINTATGTWTWDTTGYAGNYIPIIYIDSVEAISGGSINVVAYKTLTINLAVSGVTWTNATTVNVIQDGRTIVTGTTTNGTVRYNIPTGTYSITALTTGYTQQSATVQLDDNKAITIDFVTGTSESSAASGAGSQYATTFTTFRVYDTGTGGSVSGVLIHVVGKAATNPISWLAQQFGAAWGENIMSTELSGLTDSAGVATFNLFQNIRYEITVTYGSIEKTFSFQSSELAGEYPIQIDVTEGIKYTDLSQIIQTTVTPEEGSITVSYTDSSLRTSAVNISLWKQQDDQYVLIDTREFISQDTSVTFNLAETSGQSYKVSIRSTTGDKEYSKDIGVTYNGPRVPIGIPDEMYIWVCLIILLMLAGIGSLVTSPMYSFVVVFVAWILYALGWMFALGAVAPTVLTLATVLAIVYYLAKRSNGGI